MYGLNQGFNYGYNQPTQDERIWVQNQTSAEAYLVAPNSFVRLWDSSLPRYYEKRADATGRPYPLEVYEYNQICQNEEIKDNKGKVDYSDEIKALNERISRLEGEIKNVSKSYADDTAIQSIQTDIHRKSRTGSEKTSSFWEDEPATAKSDTGYGYGISKDDYE